MPGLYRYWNAQINVLSRKDIENIEIHHILHSLSIAKVESFIAGSSVLDIGTGGGFPGIPLAILFPDVQFTLVDSIGKKIKVVKAVSAEIGLKNVTACWGRAAETKGKFDFIVSRAVTTFTELWPWVHGKFSPVDKGILRNGLLSLKGGDITAELEALKKQSLVVPIASFFKEAFFETKLVVYISNL